MEHYQKNEVIWNGQNGQDVFFQNEMPYDPPSQAAWMSVADDQRLPGVRGRVEGQDLQRVRHGQLLLLQPGRADRVGDRVPRCRTPPGVQLHDVFTRFLNADGGIDHVVNDTGAPVTADNPGPSDIVTYPAS